MRLLLATAPNVYSGTLLPLIRANHYEADLVHSGPEALDYLLTGGYDGAIMDMELEGMDGAQVTRSLREAGVDVPVLVLTAQTGVESMVRALDSGANDCLVRPFHEKELLARIRVLTRSRSSRATSVLHMGDLSLDRAAFTVSTAEASEHLTGKEYQILETLMSNPQVRISSGRLLELIWGDENSANINVLWVHISYLRRKLRRIGSRVQIRAIRNGGYYLEYASTPLQPGGAEL